jgi:hypothetical protein
MAYKARSSPDVTPLSSSSSFTHQHPECLDASTQKVRKRTTWVPPFPTTLCSTIFLRDNVRLSRHRHLSHLLTPVIPKLTTAQLDWREVDGGATGHFTFPSFSGHQPDTLHSYRPPGDSTFLPEEYTPPSTTTTNPYHSPYPPGALSNFPDTPRQEIQQSGSFSGVTNEDNALTPHSSGFSNLPPLLPALSSSDIVGQRPPTFRRNHASGSTIGRFHPVQGGQYNAPSAVGPVPRRKGRQRLSASSVTFASTSARGRHHPYVASNGFEQAGHGNYALPPSAPAQVTGLQRLPSGSSHRKLLSHDYDAREALLLAETWLKNQIEEPVVTPTDEFLIREYISSTDRTRFYAFVGTNPNTRMVACRITHNVTVGGQSITCAYEAGNAKDTIAHVALFFGYKGYKCQSREPGHPW